MCGHAKFCTSALLHPFPQFFLQTNSGSRTCTRLACVWTCEILHICTFVCISTIFFANKLQHPHLHAHCTNLGRNWTCEISHIHTFLPISTIFCKQTPAATPARMLHTSHFRTLFLNFLQINFSSHTRTHITHISYMCRGVKFCTLAFSHTFSHFLQTNSGSHTCMHLAHISTFFCDQTKGTTPARTYFLHV